MKKEIEKKILKEVKKDKTYTHIVDYDFELDYYLKKAISLTLEEAEKKFEGDLLSKDNHILGCMLEAFENVLIYRGFKKEADMLSEVASKLK